MKIISKLKMRLWILFIIKLIKINLKNNELISKILSKKIIGAQMGSYFILLSILILNI